MRSISRSDAGSAVRGLRRVARRPLVEARLLCRTASALRGTDYGERFSVGAGSSGDGEGVPGLETNPLRAYFDAHTEGPGIWKWSHYFDLYHRHFGKFVGRDVNVLEIGIFSGGSLGMWKHYFGSGCRVYGVDIAPECKVYEDETTTVLIGDQADREFWRAARERMPPLDIVIDDGGHDPEQQIVTLEETLPYLTPGGVFVCEDIHGRYNAFAAYVNGLAAQLNSFERTADAELRCTATPVQAAIHSVHLYPYVAVIERNDLPLRELAALRRGTEWQPHLGSQWGRRPDKSSST